MKHAQILQIIKDSSVPCTITFRKKEFVGCTIKDIHFQSHEENKWGMCMNFDHPWKKWKVTEVVKGCQGETNGLQCGWRVIQLNVNDKTLVLNDKTKTEIKENLIAGNECVITFAFENSQKSADKSTGQKVAKSKKKDNTE